MTADELKKLAEFAGLNPKEMIGNIRYWEKRQADWVVWQPHLRIEQAMMVADRAFGFWQLTRSKTIDDEWRFRLTAAYIHKGHGCLTVDSRWMSTPSEAICAAALAAKEV